MRIARPGTLISTKHAPQTKKTRQIQPMKPGAR
jgi:hypothetical protein